MSSTVIPTNFQAPEQAAPAETGTAAPVTVYVPQTASAPQRLQAFLKGQPKALGTVQIMIGLLILLSGIAAIIVLPRSVFIASCVPFWGSVIYIIAGSLCIAAENELHGKGSSSSCLVRGALGMNIFSIIAAGLSIIFLSLDLSGILNIHCSGECYECKTFFKGIICVSFVFTILEFIISICLSAFACKADTCCCSPQVLNVHQVVMPQSYAFRPNPSHDLNKSEVPLVSNSLVNHNPADNAPQYSKCADPKYKY
ncbi:membrane-spanning 4-domains subfamily A member 15-like [Siphateles boraxobius]|uniref:membrane-spanning 4-domains subfamily A member 15-like n=1 Tax=Siphateles boraxobius TaxID=180520 RepID=UPI004064C7C8